MATPRRHLGCVSSISIGRVVNSKEKRKAPRLQSDYVRTPRRVAADMPHKAIEAAVRSLSFDDLRDWAGETILNRGKRYVKRVDHLRSNADDVLVAWVTGSERYATSVQINGKGGLEHSCTCPYALGPCKHAVAVVLAAAEYVKSKKAIPVLEEDDDFSRAVAHDSNADDAAGDEWDDEPDDEPVVISTRRPVKAQTEVRNLLGSRSHAELLELLIDLSGRFPNVRRHIVEAEQLASGQVGKLVRALRSEIRELAAEPAWYNHWRDEGSLPDYSHVEEKLRALAGQGHADAVVQLGGELWTRGIVQVGQCNDEGETAMAIASCLQTVIEALPQSSLSPPEQLLWVIERLLEDEYSLLESAEDFFKNRNYTRPHWQEVAGTLEGRLQAMPKSRTGDFYDRYRRDRLLAILLDAYNRAGWNDRVVPRLEAEVEACQCYPRLVDELIRAGELERARRWCIQGHARIVGSAPGTAAVLQERLRAMAQKERRYDLVAAYRAEEFFDAPSIARFGDLRKAAEKAECWPVVRAAVLSYLETGRYPPRGGRQGKDEGWPLPPLDVEQPAAARRAGSRQFPDLSLLIDIAITEKRLEDVADLYQRHRATTRLDWETDKKVAQAVAGNRPDLALGIWQRIVDSLIAQTKPRAYEEAAVYLRLMKQVYTQNRRVDDWLGLLSRLRGEHKAKRRLVEVLDNLSNKKLIP